MYSESKNPEGQGNQPIYHDWREERRQERRAMREEHHDRRIHGLFPGLILILLGSLFMAAQLGWINGDQWWQYLLIGLGGVFIVTGFAQYIASGWHGELFSRFLPGAILIIVGVMFMFGFTTYWPLILVAVGLAIILRRLFP